MIPNIFSLLGESIVGKHIAKGIIFSNSPKKFHPNGSRIQEYILHPPSKNLRLEASYFFAKRKTVPKTHTSPAIGSPSVYVDIKTGPVRSTFSEAIPVFSLPHRNFPHPLL